MLHLRRFVCLHEKAGGVLQGGDVEEIGLDRLQFFLVASPNRGAPAIEFFFGGEDVV